MTEDKAFNAFLKGKLEEDVEVPALRFPCRVAPFWRRPALIAASLAVVCGLAAWQVWSVRDARLESRSAQAIDLIAEWDGSTGYADEAGDSFSERLLAWQDAPFAELAE